MGSLTGVVASQIVPEAREGLLRLVGNQPVSAMAKASLTARGTPRAETKVGHSDPVAPHGRAMHTDKSYSRDNRLMLPKRP